MSTRRKGEATEAAVLGAFVKRGLGVFLPFGGGQPFDLVVQVPTETFLRVQCKTGRPKGGCVEFNSRCTDHGRGRQPYLGLADLFGVHCEVTDSVYLVPVAEAQGFVVRLRLEPARNNQRRRVRLAAEYEIDRWSDEDLATLVAEPRQGPLAPAPGGEAPAAVA